MWRKTVCTIRESLVGNVEDTHYEAYISLSCWGLGLGSVSRTRICCRTTVVPVIKHFVEKRLCGTFARNPNVKMGRARPARSVGDPVPAGMVSEL